ncbi:hypothetical protein COY32_05140 [candidate division WWE3 bacterium CG_4_10_14_0_2_um_filter_41_14]|uniref:YgjP-like metallopeptidase domain-containing protein n=1 Tax=candidate division WWE3 bacterium CG_4_10_14_0_2_um_filter_41_14 TaxID=1975072 RepID=A0A2M7TH47_UNCKA|nr:MAG: hypothetical protein COY32_05140 [candidate division WWE3 bacterium CG_4_10_14_0_2_um_filter_41_14]
MEKPILLIADYKSQKENARKIITQHVAQYNSFYEFPYSSIRIKNQKSRWGSCSSNKILNFNFIIVLLPDELRD